MANRNHKYLENVAKLKYVGTAATNKNLYSRRYEEQTKFGEWLLESTSRNFCVLWNARLVTVSVSQVNPATASYSIPLGSSLILFSHLWPGLPSGLFPLGCRTRFRMHVSSILRVLHALPSHLPWFDHRNNILWSVQVTKILIVQTYPASHHFLLLTSKYSPQNPVPRHLQCIYVLLLVWETKFHTHIIPRKL
jgi:hypothetical protein